MSATGTVFARYRVESLIGRGGMGVVYLATDLSLHRPVALKLIAPELAQDERFRKRFLRESELAAALDHPNVVPIYEAGQHDGQLFLAMRYVEGSDLGALIPLERGAALALLDPIASALDAAHRRALVHRDVKPGNILVDTDGHPYLTDFGVTKQLGGDTTETGGMVGSLDYLAPEQIAGGTVDGRTDVYALGCVLYECLTGAPPFRRDTEAETLWAHMRADFAALDGPLDPVFKRVFARDAEDRFASCSELIAAAGTAAPGRLVRRRHAILAAGVLALLAAVVLALTTGRDGDQALAVTGIAALDSEGGLRAFATMESAPSNLAVGEGAIWALHGDDAKLDRIDPESGAVTRTFTTVARPSDLAAGAGALWVGDGDGEGFNYTVSISRVDPRSGRITHTAKLPDPTEGAGAMPSEGFPRIAVGAGAVWALDPDTSVSHIDPRTGRIVATINTVPRVSTIAAGREGVWFLSWSEQSAMRIDPRTNRIAERIRLNSDALAGIAVGAGSVWVTSPDDGLLWRIEPGPRPIARSIDVGRGSMYVVFGGGAVWTGNYTNGTVSRIDPRTNAVTAQVTVGAVQTLAFNAGTALVGLAGTARDGNLASSGCGPVVSGNREPDFVVASDLSLQGREGAIPRGLTDAIQLVFKRHEFRAGRHAVGYQSCDDSTTQTGSHEQRKCAANAAAFAGAKRVVAVLGPFESFCADLEVPTLNQAPGGPLANVSPSNSYPFLTRGGRLLQGGTGPRDAPERYSPSGTRSYFRVIGREDVQGVALAMFASERRLKHVYLLHDPQPANAVWFTSPFARAAGLLGVGVAGEEEFDPAATDYTAVAARVARAGADGVVIGGDVQFGGGRLIKALRARLGDGTVIMVGERFGFVSDLLKKAGKAAHGVYQSTADVPPAALPPTSVAGQFARDLGQAGNGGYALQAGQAAEVVLQAIARSDGTRASVVRELRATRVQDGILGSFAFDRYGDIVPAAITLVRVTGATPPDVELPISLRGAVVERVLHVPASLSG